MTGVCVGEFQRSPISGGGVEWRGLNEPLPVKQPSVELVSAEETSDSYDDDLPCACAPLRACPGGRYDFDSLIPPGQARNGDQVSRLLNLVASNCPHRLGKPDGSEKRPPVKLPPITLSPRHSGWRLVRWKLTRLTPG